MRIAYSDKSLKQLKKLDHSISNRIVDYLDAVAKLKNPRSRGKALVGNLAGIWRYRVGDYRILCRIKDDALEILVVEIAHRRNVYDNE